jgi:ribonuclease HI
MHEQFSSTAGMSQTIDWDFINNIPDCPARDFPPISTHELWTVLGKTSNTSAPGLDHLTWRHLKILLTTPRCNTALVYLFNNIVTSGMWLQELKEAVSVIIPKPKKDDYSVPKAYRPIALLNTLGKLLTKIIANRLQFDSIANNLLHEGQFGGVQKHATDDVGVLLMDFISSHRDQGLHTSVLALDIAQFFPSLSHSVMAVLLRKLGFHHSIVSFITSFFSHRFTTYKWGAALSQCLPFYYGMPQGNCLSPILSALYISLVLRYLYPHSKDSTSKTRCLFFVDDGTLITASTNLTNNTQTLQTSYLAILSFFAKIGLTIEASKTELKHFIAFDLSASRRKFAHVSQPSLSFTFNGCSHIIKPVENWCYLGFYFDSFLKFDYHVKYYTNKAFSSLRACSMLGNSTGGLGPRSRPLVLKACVLPILLYGLPLWYAEWGRGVIKHVKHMSRVQNYAIRWITGGFRTSPIGSLDLISGIPPLKITCNIRIIRYMAQIASLPDNHMLKEAWQVDQPHKRLAGLHFRCRPKNLPSDNPLQHLRTGKIKEQFFEYHEANRPGTRVCDLYPECIIIHNMHHPKKNNKGFNKWKREFQAWLHDQERTGTTMIFTDGSYQKTGKGAYSVCISEHHQWIHDHSDWCAAASSYDSELAAIKSAIQWICTHRRDTDNICIASDNKSIISSFLDMSAHSSQTTSLHINLALLDLFSHNKHIKIHVTHCPSHVGIVGNERADKLASFGGGSKLIPPPILCGHFINDYLSDMDAWWKAQASSQEYRGQQWLAICRKKKRFMPSIRNKPNCNFFVDTAKGSIVLMSRITHCITNHVPTGEYRQ